MSPQVNQSINQSIALVLHATSKRTIEITEKHRKYSVKSMKKV